MCVLGGVTGQTDKGQALSLTLLKLDECPRPQATVLQQNTTAAAELENGGTQTLEF